MESIQVIRLLAGSELVKEGWIGLRLRSDPFPVVFENPLVGLLQIPTDGLLVGGLGHIVEGIGTAS